MSTQILSGLRVLDLSRMLSGPYCTMMLADHGAEVIKIEGASGDTSRNNGPYREDDPDHDWAGYFVNLNRNKKSVQLDLKSDAGKTAFHKLAATADVIVESFRPGVMYRLDLSYESLAEVNGIVGAWTAAKTKVQLTDCRGGKVAFGPLNTIRDIVADLHVAARQMLAEVPHPDPAAAP